MASSSNWVVWCAITADVGVAVAKFVAAAVTGSSAMFSEAIHSTVDTANSVLLLVGVRLSNRPADELHPLGHAHELYVWSLLVAVLILGLGGGLSVYEGIEHLRHAPPLEPATANYWVLGVSFAFGLFSFVVTLREFRGQMRPGQTLWHAVRASKDPTVFTVLLEDAAALLGVVIAFAGVWLGHRLNNVYLDGVASLLIGLLLAAVAGWLVHECRGLLVGEAADPAAVRDIRRRVDADPDVRAVLPPLTLQMGPHDVVVALKVEFNRDLSVAQLEATVDRLEAEIRAAHPDVTRIFVEAATLPRGTAPLPPRAALPA